MPTIPCQGKTPKKVQAHLGMTGKFLRDLAIEQAVQMELKLHQHKKNSYM